MKKYNTILFDLDGTVLDTGFGLLKAIDEMIVQCGLSDITQQQKHSMIGPPIEQSLKTIYHLSAEETAVTAAVFRKAYSEKYLLDAIPYPGILELMQQLHIDGWKLGVATYKRNDYAQRLMQSTGVSALCDFALGSDGKNQSKADIIRICLAELACSKPENCIMVGDTVHDYEGAVNAKTAFLGVTYGFGFRTCAEIMDLGSLAACTNAQEMRCVFARLMREES